ncbi:unnamed protein product [Eruca vesicaria subsp. sativa]|uniref:Uncharacterized protein n=1 Tax=Eruca vesicaria subsp. sativa TaxID=29727 RepID=A0ABC8K9B8_ERUVS|nr:unnamed protein product [Eruca vesicaria subsp. sativa]
MEWDSDSNLSCGDEVADDGSAETVERFRFRRIVFRRRLVSSSGFLGAKSVAFRQVLIISNLFIVMVYAYSYPFLTIFIRTHMYGRTVMIAVDKIPVYDSAEDELTSEPPNLGVLRMSTRYLFVAWIFCP